MSGRGISNKGRKELMGHKTPSMFERYSIVDTAETCMTGANRLDGLLGPTEVDQPVRLVAGSACRRPNR